MKKIALILSLACLSLACAKEAQNPDPLQTEKQVILQQVTLVAGQEVATKTYFNKSNGVLTWTDHESSMGVYDGTALQTFTHVETTEEGAQASFTGTADVNVATWTAVHPKHHASVADSKVYVTFPPIQTARAAGGMLADINTMAAQVTHDGSGNLDHFTMKNVGGLLKLTVAKAGIKTITVSSRNGEPLTGKAELSFDGSGNPVVTPVDYNYETFVTLKADDLNAGLAAGEYFVSVFPVTMTTGLIIDMENIDGTVASVKSSTAATVARSADLEFAGFDTGASWYTPKETTISLNFKASTWPFNENITSSSNDGVSWAGDGEKTMTLTSDNSILFYLHCSNWATAKSGTNGMRFGSGAGDYLLFPAIPGMNLSKIVVKHSQNDNSNPAIMTRGGNEVVEGGTAEGNASQNGEYTWNLVGTAHNMQYRYQLTKGSIAFIASLELTYVSKNEYITIGMPFYNPVTNVVVNPFSESIDATIKNYTSSPGVFTIKGTSYQVTFSGGNDNKTVRLANGTDKHGLGLASGARILLPTIENYRLYRIQTGYAGQSDSNSQLPNRSLYLSPDTGTENAVWSKTFKGATLTNYPTEDIYLSETIKGTDYYLLITSGWFYLPYLTLTYVKESAPAPAPAPAQLLDGGETEL